MRNLKTALSAVERLVKLALGYSEVNEGTAYAWLDDLEVVRESATTGGAVLEFPQHGYVKLGWSESGLWELEFLTPTGMQKKNRFATAAEALAAMEVPV